MNQKVLKTLEYYKIIDRLTDCAASEPGKKMCRELVRSFRPRRKLPTL